ncbi:hypothetical protein GGR52DRAFT_49577 [Hypoxylon sp. FL1284]|nr:hypothetical protein GGR52DRAFT_49577 [Hypoxylon sp. FL1284]
MRLFGRYASTALLSGIRIPLAAPILPSDQVSIAKSLEFDNTAMPHSFGVDEEDKTATAEDANDISASRNSFGAGMPLTHRTTPGLVPCKTPGLHDLKDTNVHGYLRCSL